MSVCVLCFMFECVGELYVECEICVGEMIVFYLKLLSCFWLCSCWLIHVWSSKEYVCCVCDPSVCLSVLSTCQICGFV